MVQPPRTADSRSSGILLGGFGLAFQDIVLARVVVPKLLAVRHVPQSEEESLSWTQVRKVKIKAKLVREPVARRWHVISHQIRVRCPFRRGVPDLQEFLESQVQYPNHSCYSQVVEDSVLQTDLLLPDFVQEVRVGPRLLELGDELASGLAQTR